MKSIFRNTGFTVLTVSLIILSLGSIPQTFGGVIASPFTVTSTITIEISCGIAVTGAANFGLVSIGETIFNNDVTISNGGTGSADVTANAGLPSAVANPAAGGYRGTTDLITHINPSSITLQIDSQGQITMANTGADVFLGNLANGDPGVLEVGVTITPVNEPFSDASLVADYDLTVTDCVFL